MNPSLDEEHSSMMSQPSLHPPPNGTFGGDQSQSLADSFLFLMCDKPSSKIPVDLKGRCSKMSTTQGKKSVLKKKVPKGRQTLQSILNLYFLQQLIKKVKCCAPKVHNNGLKGYNFYF